MQSRYVLDPELTARSEMLKRKEQAFKLQRRREKRSAQKKNDRRDEKAKAVHEIALVVVAIMAPDCSWLADFVAQHDEGAEMGMTEDSLCEDYLKMTTTEVADLLSPATQRGLKLLRSARKFTTAFRMKHWVETQNVTKGLAPSIGDTIQMRQELTASQEVGDCSEDLFSSTASATYKFMQRFSRKWGVCMRKPGGREYVPLELARKKVWLA